MFKGLFATKSLEMLAEEAKGENRLRRILGPVGLTSLGVGAIIGAGIFVMTGRVATNDAGPGILISFAVAGVACALAAFCYAEFASMAPVAGSAYTYAYATLGELLAWIIGWDLILEYAMSAATVAAAWTNYLNELLKVLNIAPIPEELCNDPFSVPGAYLNLPAVLILALCTFVLVIGIRESAASNTALVLLKLGVVIFVIVVGIAYVQPARWTTIPVEARRVTEQIILPDIAEAQAKEEAKTAGKDFDFEKRAEAITKQALAVFLIDKAQASGNAALLMEAKRRHEKDLPTKPEDQLIVEKVLAQAKAKAPEKVAANWGILAYLGINESLGKIDDATRTPFMPYGFSGVMLGAAIVFFAFIGFDSISTHSEEAIKPQRDVPIGIIASLVICTVLYVAVAAVITGMVPYPDIDTKAAVASAFSAQAGQGGSPLLNAAAGLIAVGALAGMTSVLLITFLSQARIFLAMARDGLLPQSVFGSVHERFRTPHISTIFTGSIMCVVAAFTPISDLENMVNIGTLFAFVVVCAAVLILRIKRPDAHRPFRCPLVFIVAPLGILINLVLMLFLSLETWGRLVGWLVIGLILYFTFGYWHSKLRCSRQASGGG